MKIAKISRSAPSYPVLLKEIPDPPKQLYILGKYPLDDRAIAIVGSRKVTSYGKMVTHQLAYDLARSGITIISGLAFGVDRVAHQAALEAGGRTIAILACGLDHIYPASNRGLGERILKQGGCIISEYPSGTPPLKQHFPARNRIISGLSQATIVTEAALRSGSLITAAFALEQNREVLAVPGSIISPTSQGTNNLIKSGAHLITDAHDVLAVLSWESKQQEIFAYSPDNAEEALLLQLLDEGIHDSEDLQQRSGLEAIIFNQTLTLMEINGKIRSLGGGKWHRN